MQAGGGPLLPPERPATFASHLLDPCGFRDRDLAAAVLDQSLGLQILREQCHGGSSDAEGGADAFLRGMQACARQPLMAQNKPTTQALLRRMHRIAGGNLLRLRQHPIAASFQKSGDLLVAVGRRQKLHGRYTQASAADIDASARWGAVGSGSE